MKHNKLVRDRVPEIIKASGKQVIVKQLNQAEHFEQARLKLYEELKEYEDTNIDEECLEELADILELAYELGRMHGASFDEMNTIREEKRERKGGFEKGLFLEEVLE
ncbi:nucleoside triphosphate pyrophosphohydrolase [Exiguobacterium alkaliphilum]|uniref:Nucleoside triphosphate pyrophosphohydrolase n=1 Tax=Exiguobacterium alkaliphilum TaxID=1428684 RepID=A0ABT2KZ07_9BACL|nr:nucleoside triphosphate pyrophosphohydrolase [Exiguobacterium alkaliphilum]MCT4795674.1 nucleoside triphosphate pyrophosphohydrolase [Exiguobacterium alkaliphilum]